MHAAEEACDFVGQRVIDIADEAQRQVLIFGIYPAGAGQAAPHYGKRLGDGRRNFETGEQAGHDKLQLVLAIRRLRRMG
jgi:hypothetical protein